MKRFEWEAEYSVGHAEIDRQHRGIIAIMNHLYELLVDDSADAQAEAEHVFDSLATYVSTHFAYEEDLMRRVGYPEDQLAAHKATHDALLARVQSFMAAWSGGDPGALKELLPFLYGDWLIEHICKTDRDYAGWVALA